MATLEENSIICKHESTPVIYGNHLNALIRVQITFNAIQAQVKSLFTTCFMRIVVLHTLD